MAKALNASIKYNRGATLIYRQNTKYCKL